MAQSGGPGIGMIAILGIGGYLLYNWWTSQTAAASTTPAAGSTTPPAGTSTSTVPIGTAAPPYTTAVTSQPPPATIISPPAQTTQPVGPAINMLDGFNPANNNYSQGLALQNTYLVVWGTFPVSPAPAVQINGQTVPSSAITLSAATATGAPGPTQMNINLQGLGQVGSNTLTITTSAGTVSATFQITAQASTSISCNTAAWNAMAAALFAHAQSDSAMVGGKMNGWQWDWHVVNDMGGAAVNGWSSDVASQQMDVCSYMAFRAQYNANTGLSGIGAVNVPLRWKRGNGGIYPAPRLG
jgi:hypothetical protein